MENKRTGIDHEAMLSAMYDTNIGIWGLDYTTSFILQKFIKETDKYSLRFRFNMLQKLEDKWTYYKFPDTIVYQTLCYYYFSYAQELQESIPDIRVYKTVISYLLGKPVF